MNLDLRYLMMENWCQRIRMTQMDQRKRITPRTFQRKIQRVIRMENQKKIQTEILEKNRLTLTLDYEEAYADVIHEYSGYREMLGNCGPNAQSLYIGNISSWNEIISYKPETLGYCFCDIDMDGICEMFIMDGDDVMYAMYALINGSPENVFYGNSVNKYVIERTGENACLIRNYVDKDSDGKRYDKVYRYSQGELTAQYSYLEEQNVVYYDDKNLTETWVGNSGDVHFYLMDSFRNADWDKIANFDDSLPDVILADAAGLKVTSAESEQAQIDDTFKDAEVISLPQRTEF